jgi:hypothetical protein
MMRKACVLIVVVACGGDDTNQNPDAAVADARPIDAAPDADTSIYGSWIDTYFTASGTITQSVCGAAPFAVTVDAATAAVIPYQGMCRPDGTFRIPAPGNLGTYYIRAQGALYETNRQTGIDLSTDRLGRPDVAGIVGVKLALDLTGMTAWANGDLLMAFAPNIGFFQNLSFAANAPAPGNTVVNATANWFGYQLDAGKSDALMIVQLAGKASSNGTAYLTLDRAYSAPAFSMASNTTHDLSGAFASPGVQTLDLAIDAGEFDDLAEQVSPSVATRAIGASVFAAPSTDVIASPAMFSFARDSSTLAGLDFGTISYGDPFPALWNRYVRVQASFAVPYTWANITSPFTATVTRVLPRAAADGQNIDPILGPPTDVKFDGVSIHTAEIISPVPVVTWSAPTLGTPTDYEIQVYEVQASGVALTFLSTLRLTTKGTSVRIPAGYLLGQRQYVFVVRARSREGVDIHTKPLRAGPSWSSADTISALVTTST